MVVHKQKRHPHALRKKIVAIFKDGFTLIELLTVIAIIGLLAAIVMTALNNSRIKAKDSKMKLEMVGLRSAAELYYYTDNSYLNLFNSDNTCSSVANSKVEAYLSSITTLAGAGNYICISAPGGYAMAARLPSGTYWCVDSKGESRGKTFSGTVYDGLSGTPTSAITNLPGAILRCN